MWNLAREGVLRRVLRKGVLRREVLEGHRRQKHATTPLARALDRPNRKSGGRKGPK